MVDAALLRAVGGNASNSFLMNPALTTLGTLEALRNQCNGQKMAADSRFCFLNTPLASTLNADDRMKSKLFYGALQGDRGFRKWQNVAGFSWVREYTDFPAGAGFGGLAGDPRLVAVSVRKIEDITRTAKALGVPQVMEFHSLADEATGLELCAIAWQKQGTGDVILSAAILFGLGVGNQGGAAGTMTDDAGCLIRIQ